MKKITSVLLLIAILLSVCACGVENECKETKTEDKKGSGLEELLCLHLGRNGDTKEDCNKVCEHLLCGFGKGVEHSAFADKVTEHQKTYKRY